MELLDQQSNIYLVSDGELVSIAVSALGTPPLIAVSLDGISSTLSPDNDFQFSATGPEGRHHIIELALEFSPESAAHASYTVRVSGSDGGQFSIEVARGNPQLTRTLTLIFRVGDTGPK